LAGVDNMIGGQWQLVLHWFRALVESQTTVILLSELHILKSTNIINDYNTPVLSKPWLLQT